MQQQKFFITILQHHSLHTLQSGAKNISIHLSNSSSSVKLAFIDNPLSSERSIM